MVAAAGYKEHRGGGRLEIRQFGIGSILRFIYICSGRVSNSSLAFEPRTSNSEHCSSHKYLEREGGRAYVGVMHKINRSEVEGREEDR